MCLRYACVCRRRGGVTILSCVPACAAGEEESKVEGLVELFRFAMGDEIGEALDRPTHTECTARTVHRPSVYAADSPCTVCPCVFHRRWTGPNSSATRMA